MEPRPGHSRGLGKPGGDEYLQDGSEITKNIQTECLPTYLPTYLPVGRPTYLVLTQLQSHLEFALEQ